MKRCNYPGKDSSRLRQSRNRGEHCSDTAPFSLSIEIVHLFDKTLRTKIDRRGQFPENREVPHLTPGLERIWLMNELWSVCLIGASEKIICRKKIDGLVVNESICFQFSSFLICIGHKMFKTKLSPIGHH